MKIIGKRISTKQFEWDSKNRIFSAWASDLSSCTGDLLKQLFDDACDQGFVLVSQWTGKEVPVVLVRTKTDDDRDVISWDFESHGIEPAFGVAIFND